MCSLSINPVEYIKSYLHLDSGVGRKRLFSGIFSKIGDLAEYAAAGALVALVIFVVIFAFIQISAATTVVWYYYTSISKVIFTP
jgi:hypothetical protein